jgi:two-component system phosphate regulon sensor histidine kinase PhoR
MIFGTPPKRLRVANWRPQELPSHHEIRTPLSTLCLISEELEAGNICDEEERREHYRALAEESRRLRRVILSFLEFTRIEADVAAYRFDTVDLVELIRQVGQEFEHEFASRGYRVEIQLSDETLFISANEAAIRTILWNLMDNAMKYSPICHTVWISGGRECGNVAIRVQDHGLGIPEAELTQVFRKFVRGETAKKIPIPGTGVGLAIVRHIVDLHHGEIHVQSKVGQGSTFTVLLPGLK